MRQSSALLMMAALVEGATAVAIMLAPGLAVRLLFVSDLDETGLRVARIAGIVLFAFALACWVAARNGEPKAPMVGMLVYNLLIGGYFLFVCAKAPDIGPLLWPVTVLHVVFAAMLARALRSLLSEDKK